MPHNGETTDKGVKGAEGASQTRWLWQQVTLIYILNRMASQLPYLVIVLSIHGGILLTANVPVFLTASAYIIHRTGCPPFTIE